MKRGAQFAEPCIAFRQDVDFQEALYLQFSDNISISDFEEPFVKHNLCEGGYGQRIIREYSDADILSCVLDFTEWRCVLVASCLHFWEAASRYKASASRCVDQPA